MDNRILMAGLGVLALVGVGAAAMMVGGGGDDGAETVETPKKGKKAKTAEASSADGQPPVGGRQQHDPAKATPSDGPVKPSDQVVHDESYEERAKAARELREKRNTEYYEKSMAATREWVVSAGLDEATGLQVQAIVQKTHDSITQTKLDMEDGVIRAPEGREEMKWAREENRIQLVNLLGEEKADALDAKIREATAFGN